MTYMPSLTVRIPDALEVKLEQASQARGISKSDLAREAIERLLRRQTLCGLRERLAPNLEAQGMFTEEDVLNRLDSGE